MQEESAPVEPIIDGNSVVEAVLDGFLMAFTDWWYVWALMIVVGVGLALLNNWSRRVEARARVRRRQQERDRR